MKNLKFFLLVLFLYTCPVSAQNIVKAEYWLNTDPGMGLATDISGITAAPNVANLIFSVPSTISPGIHTLGLRSKDSNNRWSHTNMFPVLVLTPPANAIIDSIEYFVETDPGFGSGTVVTGFTPQQSISNLALTIPASLSTGIHTIGVRSKDTEGNWGHTNFFPVLVNDTTTGVIVALEYFWDVDTGFYQVMPYTPSSIVTDLSNELMSINVPSNLPFGQHSIFVRSLDSRRRWSHTNYALGIDVISGFEDISQLGISIYPNPVSDKMTVDAKDSKKMRIILYDLSGKCVMDRFVESKSEIDMNELSPGIYSILIWAERNKMYRSEIVKL